MTYVYRIFATQCMGLKKTFSQYCLVKGDVLRYSRFLVIPLSFEIGFLLCDKRGLKWQFIETQGR